MIPLLVVAVVVLAIVVFILVKRNQQQPTSGVEQSASEPEETRTEKRERELKERLDALLKLNIDIRTSGYSTSVLNAIENIINKLRNLLPVINEEYPHDEMTWDVNQTAEEYIQRAVSTYAKLNTEQRSGQEASFIETLSDVERAIDEVQSAVDSHNISQFKGKTKFLEARFARF